jgi:hypothetical protein
VSLGVRGFAAVQAFSLISSDRVTASHSASRHQYRADPEQDDRTRSPKRQVCVSQS